MKTKGLALFPLLAMVFLGAGCDKKQVTEILTSNQATNINKTVNQAVSTDPNQPPLLLKSIGINLDAYDPTTNRAGDLQFTKAKISFGDYIFTDFGYVIKAANSASGQDKASPQPTWLAPLGTKVHSLVDGVVVNIPTLYSGDYSIMVGADANSQWLYETEHVINPLVNVGDRVTAGQEIAEVSDYFTTSGAGLGIVEIGILHGGNPPEHVCPFNYLDPSVKDDIQATLRQLFTDWETYRGDSTLYDRSQQATVPGCLTLDPIAG